MACPHCGSWSLKADRSLAGRLVCGRCGRPQGLQAEGRRSASARRQARPFAAGMRMRRWPWWGWLSLLLLVSALLASLPSPPRWDGPARPGASHGRSVL